jgi:predicted DCC family thiol-disulfide oxidoreductase YuxK
MITTEYQHKSTIITSDHPVVIYDLECMLCNFWVKKLLRIDRHSRVRFAHAGSAFVRSVLNDRPDLNPSDGVMMVDQGQVFQGMDAVLRIAMVVGGWLRVAGVLRMLPKRTRMQLYNTVARNRYSWFGKRALVCDLWLQKYSDRFLA